MSKTFAHQVPIIPRSPKRKWVAIYLARQGLIDLLRQGFTYNEVLKWLKHQYGIVTCRTTLHKVIVILKQEGLLTEEKLRLVNPDGDIDRIGQKKLEDDIGTSSMAKKRVVGVLNGKNVVPDLAKGGVIQDDDKEDGFKRRVDELWQQSVRNVLDMEL